MAGDNLLGLLPRLLKQSTPASDQGPVNSWQVISPGPGDVRVRDVHRQHNNKRRNMKLPFKIMLSDPASKHALETVTNPYSGQSCQLPRYAVAVYDTIKGAEVTGDVDLMRKGLTWFQKNFTDQYYVLLD